MKTMFITGGNGEIGRAIGQIFKGNNYNVISPSSKELDCSDNVSIKQYFDTFNAVTISAFVHCAGINNPKPFTQVTPDTITKTVQVNTLSFLYITQYLNQYFDKAAARIVAVSSIYGNISRSKRIEYATSKHGLRGMMQTLALELADRNIFVNTVSPGFIATSLTYKNNPAAVVESLIADVPLKKLGQPKDVADLVFYLCSENNNFITGQDIVIDGGYLCGGFQP